MLESFLPSESASEWKTELAAMTDRLTWHRLKSGP